MRIASEYRDPAASFFMGVAVVRDPNDPSRTFVLASDGAAGAVRVFDLDGYGALTPGPDDRTAVGRRQACLSRRDSDCAKRSHRVRGRQSRRRSRRDRSRLAERAALAGGWRFPTLRRGGQPRHSRAGNRTLGLRAGRSSGASAAIYSAGLRSVEVLIADRL